MSNTMRLLHQKPIAYYPIYRQMTGSTTAGIFLSQLMYWFSKKDEIFKTDVEIMEETFLTKKELENAKKIIKNLNFVDVFVKGIPAKTYYKIDWEKYEKEINKFAQKGETTNPQKGEQVSTKGGDCDTPKGETNNVNLLTETTTENTTENKKNINTKKDFTFALKAKISFENLSDEYMSKLKEFIDKSQHAMSYDEFKNSCEAKGYKYANYKAAYIAWNSKSLPVAVVQSNSTAVSTAQTAQNPIEKFIEIYKQTGRSDYAYLEASVGLSYQQQAELQSFKRDFEFQQLSKNYDDRRAV